MTMSWVAEAKATTSASPPNTISWSSRTPARTRPPSPGCTSAIPTSAAATTSCASIIHPRRRPSQRPRTGASSLSTSGAHRNFSEYASPTQDRNPMVDSSMAFSRIQKPSVLPTR